MLTLQILCLFEQLPVVMSLSEEEEEEGDCPLVTDILDVCRTAEEIPASLESVRVGRRGRGGEGGREEGKGG